MAVIRKITANEGETFYLEIAMVDANNAPVLLTNFAAELRVRQDYRDTGTPFLEASTGNGKIEIEPSSRTGIIAITVPPADLAYTARGSIAQFVYDIKLTDNSDASVITLYAGDFDLIQVL